MSSMSATPPDAAIAPDNNIQQPEYDIPYFPDHTELPESDGTFVKNFQEHPQSILLTDSITPVLQQLHPDRQYAIGQDSGIYWRLPEPPEPPQSGAEAPDWFYVPNVPPMIDGQIRRSYVLWRELIAPLIVLEFASGDGSEERDETPYKGKFWVYERVIRPFFYGIYEVKKSNVDIYHLVDGRYQLLTPNNRGHYPIYPMGVELGIWQGEYQNMELPWLRWWDLEGNLLPSSEERAQVAQSLLEQERLRAEQAEFLLEQERLRGEQLAERLRQMGIDPDNLS